MQMQAIEFTAILCADILFLAMSYAIFFNLMDMGKYLRSLGLAFPVISILCSVYLVMTDPFTGILLGLFGVAIFALNYIMTSQIHRYEKSDELQVIHAYPGEFSFSKKTYSSLTTSVFATAVLPTSIAQTSNILFVKGEKDPIVMTQITLMDENAEYKLLCRHIQNEGEQPYWHCYKVDVIYRPFSIKRILFRLFAFFTLVIGAISFSVQGGVSIAGLVMNPEQFEYISNLFGGAAGTGIFYSSKQIFKYSKIGYFIFSTLYYISLVCFIISLIGI